jgi:hypothetical protein
LGASWARVLVRADLVAADFREPRWAVPGILAEGVNLLAGSPKLGITIRPGGSAGVGSRQQDKDV